MPNDVDRPLTPGELLAAAADRIRDLAAAADKGPWLGPSVRANYTADNVTAASGRIVAHHTGDSTRWIAALSPAVAPALERLFRDAAKDWEIRVRVYTPEAMREAQDSRRFGGALAFARAVVGEGGP